MRRTAGAPWGGADWQPGAGANAAQRRGPGGWAGENNPYDWPQATDQTPCAKRQTKQPNAHQHQGAQPIARGHADGFANAALCKSEACGRSGSTTP